MAFISPTNVAPKGVLDADRYNQDVVANMGEVAPLFAVWQTFTPQLRNGTNNKTSTVEYARYLKVGKLLIAQALVKSTDSGPAGGDINLSLPTGFTYPTAHSVRCGTFEIKDINGTMLTIYFGNAVHENSAGYIKGIGWAASGYMGTSQPTMNLAVGDYVGYSVVLEVS